MCGQSSEGSGGYISFFESYFGVGVGEDRTDDSVELHPEIEAKIVVISSSLRRIPFESSTQISSNILRILHVTSQILFPIVW